MPPLPQLPPQLTIDDPAHKVVKIYAFKRDQKLAFLEFCNTTIRPWLIANGATTASFWTAQGQNDMDLLVCTLDLDGGPDWFGITGIEQFIQDYYGLENHTDLRIRRS